ncbi:BTB/POZ domain-containing protein KCTD8-like [Dendrobates tinctorius]|uniref:BTB/POZ domain-containing protein KCTD8-like n=1 Tax=Dendrobates tinctorius TaxID=92724 RepID=UPI003CC9446A
MIPAVDSAVSPGRLYGAPTDAIPRSIGESSMDQSHQDSGSAAAGNTAPRQLGSATTLDVDQRIKTIVTATNEPGTDEKEEKMDTVTPLQAKNHEPDSGNELSSSSLDSHDSASASTELPSESNIPKTDDFSVSHDESPSPTITLELSNSLKEHDQSKTSGSRRNSMQDVAKENGVKSCEDPLAHSEERKSLEVELIKCIEEFRKIRIPVVFPNKKRNWQNELLRKYEL